MKKKNIISAIALGLLSSNLLPIVANAKPLNKVNYSITKIDGDENSASNIITNAELEKKYPNLIAVNKEGLQPVVFDSEIMLRLDEIIKNIDKADEENDLELVSQSLIDVLEIHRTMNIEQSNLHKEYDQIDYIIMKGIYLGFKLTENLEDKAIRDKYFINLIDNMYLSSAKKFNTLKGGIFLSSYAYYMFDELSDYFKNDRTKEILGYGASMILDIQNYKPSADDSLEGGFIADENERPSTVKPDIAPPPEPEPLPPPVKPEPPQKPPVTKPEGNIDYVKPEQSIKFETTDYKKKKNRCYKVTTYYVDGTIKNKKENLLPKEQNAFCGIYERPVVSGNKWNETHHGSVALQVWNSLAENELNEESNLSLQYTIEKDKDKPYYYDSGIRVSKDSKASYTQLVDVLNQIAQKIESYIIEDKDKFLFIAEGKPLVVKEMKEEYSAKEVSELLKTFNNIGLKIDKIKDNEGTKIEESISNDNLKDINIKDKSISLSKRPVLKEGILQLPVKEVAEELGYTVEDTNNKLTLNYDKDGKKIKIEYEKNTKNIIINGTKKVMTTSSQTIDKELFAEMNLVVKELGMNIQFDSDSGKIEIK